MSPSSIAARVKEGPRDWSNPNVNQLRETHDKNFIEFFFSKPFWTDILEKGRDETIIESGNQHNVGVC